MHSCFNQLLLSAPAVYTCMFWDQIHFRAMQMPMGRSAGCHLLNSVTCLSLATLHAGNGANMAFSDAWSLAQQLTDPSHKTLQAAVTAYDAEAIPRSTKAVEAGKGVISMIHSTGIRYVLTCMLFWVMGTLARFSVPRVALPLLRLVGRR